MKVNEVLANVDRLVPNSVDNRTKILWLDRLERNIIIDVFNGREMSIGDGFSGYDETNTSKEMLVPTPYDDLYEMFLASMIHHVNKEENSYNNETTRFNNRYEEFMIYWNRTHKQTLNKHIKY